MTEKMSDTMRKVLRHRTLCPKDDADDIARALGMHPDAVRTCIAMATKEMKDAVLRDLAHEQKYLRRK